MNRKKMESLISGMYSLFRKNYKLFTISHVSFLCGIFPLLSLFSHDERMDSVRNVKTPELIFSQEKLQQIRSTSENDLNQKIRNYELALDEYYSQFIEEKNIQHNRDKNGEFKDSKEEVSLNFKIQSGKIPLGADVNSIRLLADSQRKGLASVYTIRDSESLFAAHAELAELYKQANEPYNAMEHYQAAFRYCNLSITEEHFMDPNSYREMKDSSDIQNIQTYIEKVKELENAKKNLITMEDEIHQLESEAMRANLKTGGKRLDIDTKSLSDRIDSEKERVIKLEEELKKERELKFIPYKQKKGEEFASYLVKYADLSRELELRERVQKRVLHSNFPLVDSKRESGFMSYLSILEFAHKLSPNDPEILKRLGDEWKSSSKPKESLNYYLKYLDLPSEKRGDVAKNREVFLNVGILYSDMKQYVNAIPYYERYYEMMDESKEKKEFTFFLGEFYSRRLGDSENASKFFSKWLEDSNENTNQTSAIFDRKKFIANFGISKYKKLSKKSKEEDQYLEECYKYYKKIYNTLNEKEQEYLKKKDEILVIKRSLLTATQGDTLEIYKEEQEKLRLLEKEWEAIKQELQAIPIVAFLYRKAERAEIRKDFKEAIKAYREVLQFGSEVENSLAIKNIQRIELIQSDGIPRAIVKD